MKAFTNEETLFPVPVINRAANHLDKIHDFSVNKMKNNPDTAIITLDATGIDTVNSPGVNIVIGPNRKVSSKSKISKIITAGKNFFQIALFLGFQSLFPRESEEGT